MSHKYDSFLAYLSLGERSGRKEKSLSSLSGRFTWLLSLWRVLSLSCVPVRELQSLEEQLRLPTNSLLRLFEAEYNKQTKKTSGTKAQILHSKGASVTTTAHHRLTPPLVIVSSSTTSSSTNPAAPVTSTTYSNTPGTAPPTASPPATQPQPPPPVTAPVLSPPSPPLSAPNKATSISCPQLQSLVSSSSSSSHSQKNTSPTGAGETGSGHPGPHRKLTPVIPTIDLSVLKRPSGSPANSARSRASSSAIISSPPSTTQLSSPPPSHHQVTG